MFQIGIRIAAILLLFVPVLATGTSAQGKPQGKGGGGGGGPPAARAAPAAHPAPPRAAAPAPRQVGKPVSAPHTAQPAAPRSAAPRGRAHQMARPSGPPPAATFARRGGGRSAASPHSRGAAPRGAHVQRQRLQQRTAARPATQIRQNVRQQRAAERAARHIERQRATSNPNFVRPGGNRNFAVQPVAPSGRGANRGTRETVLRGGALRNPAFANPSARDPAARALARATFRGRFTEQGIRFADRGGRPRPAVVGWVGPLFWPYAYDDFIDYTFYPYAYDTFWPTAYEEVYEDVFGPYAFDGTAYANVPASGRRSRSRTRQPAAGVAQVCSEQAPTLTEWPIERIAEAVQPDETQRTA